MAPPRKIYDFIIEPIRTMDQREGEMFLQRFLNGPQQVWVALDQIITTIPKLWSVTECPDQFLKYLKWIVGWTSELDNITRELSDDELRRLISISAQLWKERGSDDALINVLYFATGARCRYWNWFDFRWVLPASGPPDSVWWGGTAQFVFGVDTVAGTSRRDGMPLVVTARETGVSAQGQMAYDPGFGNYVFIGDALGYPGYPSGDPNDYEVRLEPPLGTELGEEHQGRDPWIIDLPDPSVAGAEYESNLRIVDDGALNLDLVDALVNSLMRATGERWETTYLGLLDQFLITGDTTQWDQTYADKISVENGVLELNDDLGTGVYVPCIVETAVWPEAVYSARVRSVGSPVGVLQIMFGFTDLDNGYALAIVPEGSAYGATQLILVKVELGAITYLVTLPLSATMPIRHEVYYTYRIAITNEGAVGKRIKVYMDANEVIDYLDDPSLLPEGTMGFAVGLGRMQVDEAEVVLVPQDKRPQRAVPVPFITEWSVAGDAVARTITLPLVQNSAEGALEYDFLVDWGDGTAPSHVTAWNDAARAHTYAGDGTYQVSIRGKMEGWSFNGNSDAPKLTKVVQWGELPWFEGFVYLKNGFKGCTNLNSLQGDPIPASNRYSSKPGVRSDGFEGIFYGCTSLWQIFSDLFDEHIWAENFRDAFRDCTALGSLPGNLFYNNLELGDYAFNGTFRGCTALTVVPGDLFAYSAARVQRADFAWQDCFRDCTGLTTVQPGGALDGGFDDLGDYAFASCFRGCTSLATLQGAMFQDGSENQAWQDCFRDCTGLTSLPGGLFGNGGGGAFAFERCFRDCTGLVSVGWGLFYYNDSVGEGGFNECFRGCSALESVPDGLFKTNVYCGGFVRTFYECVKLQLNEWIFFDLSNKFDRFKLVYWAWIDFTDCFYRTTFSGVAGKAPELWFGDFNEIIQALPVPVVDWVNGDHIEGQTSGHDLYINGARLGATNRWPIKRRRGNFQLGEIIGVTGVPSKLADQDPTYPQWEDSPTTGTCFSGAGNNASSITNYSEIPNNWVS